MCSGCRTEPSAERAPRGGGAATAGRTQAWNGFTKTTLQHPSSLNRSTQFNVVEFSNAKRTSEAERLATSRKHVFRKTSD